MQKVFQFIEQNYMENLTLSKIAKQAGFSPNYFCNIFKEYTGKSVNAYLTDIRIREAKKLLVTTNKSIQIIADQIGYESDSYFIKVFKTHVGQTPYQYRKTYKQ